MKITVCNREMDLVQGRHFPVLQLSGKMRDEFFMTCYTDGNVSVEKGAYDKETKTIEVTLNIELTKWFEVETAEEAFKKLNPDSSWAKREGWNNYLLGRLADIYEARFDRVCKIIENIQ